jgi:hypothetical protein
MTPLADAWTMTQICFATFLSAWHLMLKFRAITTFLEFPGATMVTHLLALCVPMLDRVELKVRISAANTLVTLNREILIRAAATTRRW